MLLFHVLIYQVIEYIHSPLNTGARLALNASKASIRSLVCRRGSYEARSKSRPGSSDSSGAREIACFAARRAKGAFSPRQIRTRSKLESKYTPLTDICPAN